MDDTPYQTPQDVLDEGMATAPPTVDERWQPSEDLARDAALISLLSALAAAVVPAALAWIFRDSWLDVALPPLVVLLLAAGVLLNACVAYFAWLISQGL